MTLMDTILRRKPVEAVEPTTMISKAVHERLMSSMGATIERLSNERNGLLRDKLAADEKLKEMAGIERYAASLKPDALKYRERCKRDREAAAAKRKAKGGVVLPDGLREQNGVIGFDCRVCDAFTGWDGEIADFEHGAHENVCGGSPRCCP